MYKIDGTKITLTRGDSFYAELELKRGSDTYTPATGDKIRFAMKRKYLNDDQTDFLDVRPLVLKSVPTDTMILKLDPEDTKSLGFGEYVYDLQIEFANGDVDTFIASAPFILAKEVY